MVPRFWRGVRNCLLVAAAYVGGVVGGGFATGREVMHFLGASPDSGIARVLVVSAGFVLGGLALMLLSVRISARTPAEVIRASCGDGTCRAAVDVLLTIFYWLVLGVVLSAGDALLTPAGLPRGAGAVLMALAVALPLSGGRRGPAVVNVSLLMMLTVTLAVAALSLSPLVPRGATAGVSGILATPDAVLYVSYNLLFAIAVFPGLASDIGDWTCIAGAGLGGAVLGFLCWAEWRLMMEVYRHVAFAQVPLRVAMELTTPWAARVYPLLVALSLVTTGLAVGSGLLSRLGMAGEVRRDVIALIFIPALFVSLIDLVRLVQGIYPVVGWFSLALWASLLVRALRGLKSETG